MIEMRKHIRQSLSTRLSIEILAVVAAVFLLSLGFLFRQSRSMIRQEAIEEASHVLDNTALRVQDCLAEVETATRNMLWLIDRHHDTDSLLRYTRRIVDLNPSVSGCSITMEPDYYPQFNHGFSAYSVRTGDSVTTVREADYDYYQKVWYKAPRQQGGPCWVDPYDDFNSGTLSSPEMIASYCVPLRDERRRFIGVVATDLLLERLAQTVTTEHPYKRSYCVMLGADGHYFVHPDTAKLLRQTIFTGADPRRNADIIALGQAMTKGQTGHAEISVNGERHIVLYRPLKGTQWSVALVCPAGEMLRGYNRLNYILLPLFIVGLVLLVGGCHRIVLHFIQPLGRLAAELRQIRDGQYKEPLSASQRTDMIGLLQNSFCQMQQAISRHIGEVEQANLQAEQRSRELEKATRMAQEASEQKTQFMQDMSHQIRTPLNIVQGFALVIRDGYDMIPDDEKQQIADTMSVQTHALYAIVRKLLDTSLLENPEAIRVSDVVDCNGLAREAVRQATHQAVYTAALSLQSSVDDTLTITTNRNYLILVITELLVNALHFTPVGSVVLRVEVVGQLSGEQAVRFTVEDTGPGIPADKTDVIFNKFTKLDMFSEGLGLGLFLCRRVALLIGASLTLDTRYTGGSRFVLDVPLKTI